KTADGGTIFLDEIADISPKIQIKLLRVLQEKEFEQVGDSKTIKVDVRVIAATNQDLTDKVRNGQFREDLFYRLNVFPIKNPSLRERIDDIPLLLEHIITAYCAENNRKPVKFEKEVFKILKNYSWPGNIRELKNIVERMLIMTPGNTIKKEAAPHHLLESDKNALMKKESPGNLTLKEFREKSEKMYIEQCLKKCGGNISRAAKLLSIERTNLHKKIKSLGIKKK
ncbi:MAG: sigma-54-dependent Fis family transcriptional regulator, partial [Calditrichia bacterium]|nr:sigma-54-dependent Fis family transcriptional regulator [Calditrichia bacterium]